MGDPMVSEWLSGTWVMDLKYFFAFFFTQNLLLTFLKILLPNFCVSMETCSMGIVEVCSLTTQELNVLELFKNRTFLNFSRTVMFKNWTFLNFSRTVFKNNCS